MHLCEAMDHFRKWGVTNQHHYAAMLAILTKGQNCVAKDESRTKILCRCNKCFVGRVWEQMEGGIDQESEEKLSTVELRKLLKRQGRNWSDTHSFVSKEKDKENVFIRCATREEAVALALQFCPSGVVRTDEDRAGLRLWDLNHVNFQMPPKQGPDQIGGETALPRNVHIQWGHRVRQLSGNVRRQLIPGLDADLIKVQKILCDSGLIAKQ